MTGILRGPRRAALVAIAVLVAAASLVSFAESYRGLFAWAHEHGLRGVWAVFWPLQVDVFIAVGELALFVALVDAWERRSRIGAWVVTLAGLTVSVAGNIGHAAGGGLTTRVTAAVPPLAAAAALAVGLGVLKRVARKAAPGGAAVTPVPEAIGGAPDVTLEGSQVTPEAISGAPVPALEAAPEVPSGALHAVPVVTRERPRERPSGAPGKQPGPATPERLQEHYAAELAAGQVPSIRQIKREWPVGYDRATELCRYLTAAADTAS
jgi:hypothetical protein